MRRSGLLVAIALLTAGCLGGASGGIPTSDAPGPQHSTDVRDGCSEGLERLTVGLDATSYPARGGGFELTVHRTTVTAGDPISIKLTNVDERMRATGAARKYLLQRRVGDRWVSVLATDDWRAAWNATALYHPPGEGFSWRFRADAAGVARDRYRACRSIPAGSYRFVYFGIDRDRSRQPLAVRFRVQEG